MLYGLERTDVRLRIPANTKKHYEAPQIVKILSHGNNSKKARTPLGQYINSESGRVKAATIFVKTRVVGLWTICHVVQEAYLSCSAGKNGVRRSTTRSRKPNSSLDREAVAMERIQELRKRRGGVLSALTAKRKEIDSLLTDENNVEAVKVKLTEITSLFQRSTDAHEDYNAALIDESQRQESVVYFADIESNLKQEPSPVFHDANFRPEERKTKHKVPRQSSSDSDEQSALIDQAFQILEQQNRVMEEFVISSRKTH
ncbi:unnamed protein product [Porites lobata]|uniref:Uncharacterized protein n=1 Tax=Porites lobata TaxID=104759 RepID=A0ABN8R719_9CNID|nr:unnamed protein product [Porites lobata]